MRSTGWWLSMTVALFCSASPASAVTRLDAVGNAGNACDTQSQGCFGCGRLQLQHRHLRGHERAVRRVPEREGGLDPLGLYNTNMGSGFGGITRSGSLGQLHLQRDRRPRGHAGELRVVLRRAALRELAEQRPGQRRHGDRRLHAARRHGDAEQRHDRDAQRRAPRSSSPARTSGTRRRTTTRSGSPRPTTSTTRRAPTRRRRARAPTATPNRANCDSAVGDLTTSGSYTGSASPYGTFDQGGNVLEWNEAIISGSDRGIRGGAFDIIPVDLAASARGSDDPAIEHVGVGFRVASSPSPRDAR